MELSHLANNVVADGGGLSQNKAVLPNGKSVCRHEEVDKDVEVMCTNLQKRGEKYSSSYRQSFVKARQHITQVLEKNFRFLHFNVLKYKKKYLYHLRPF